MWDPDSGGVEGMLALESIQVDENSMDASGTSEPGVLNTTLAPASVTGLCYQNILRPRQILCYQVRNTNEWIRVGCGLWPVVCEQRRNGIRHSLLTWF